MVGIKPHEVSPLAIGRKLLGWPYLCLSPNSAACERVFSLMTCMFGPERARSLSAIGSSASVCDVALQPQRTPQGMTTYEISELVRCEVCVNVCDM